MTSRAAAFRALHAEGCFVMPNPWDAGSAVCLHQLGFRALATTSAGASFSRGRTDALASLSLDEVLDHVREIVAATPLPVSADFQAGYGDDPEGVAVNVARCVAAGAAGLSIEDATGDAREPLYSRSQAIERIAAARSAIDAAGEPVVLTGRCEAWLVGDRDAFGTARDRLVAYAEAGADCLFAPGVRDPAQIAELVAAVAPKPLNVLVSAPGLSLAQLAGLGVRRISVGSALARVAWGAFLAAARDIAATGSFDTLGGATSFAELDDIFTARAT
jgi:2-methylisocitrate lyase-like PEP mutase family enzyme